MGKTVSDYDLLLSNVRSVMKTRQGKVLMWHMLSLAGLYDLPVPKQEDVLFQEGRRSIGLDMVMLMSDADPEMYPRLLLEFARKEEFRDAEGYGTETETGSS